jgi:hypothetical protein
MKQLKVMLALAVLSLALSAHHAAAQSTILNTPSTDVVAPKKVYVEMDFITNYAGQRDDDSKYANYAPRLVVGVARNVEAGINVSFTHVPGGGEPIELQPNAKWQFYQNEKNGVAAAAGCIGYLPITHRAGTDSLVQCYSVVSKKVSGDLGPRFHGGGYVLIGASKGERTKAGAILAYEQPFSGRTGLLLDWLSGDNRFGAVSPGLYILLPHNSSLSGGYIIANHGRGKNAFFLYYGTQF